MALCMAAAACSSGSHSASSDTGATSSVPHAATLPASGTVQLPDGRVYTVAAAGTPLMLSDIQVRLRSMKWVGSAGVSNPAPGTRAYAVVSLDVRNLSGSAHTIPITQFWLLDAAFHEYLPEARTNVPRPLVGMKVAPGVTVHGTLVFATPRRFAVGMLLVYRFADATNVAHATHVGILRLH